MSQFTPTRLRSAGSREYSVESLNKGRVRPSSDEISGQHLSKKESTWCGAAIVSSTASCLADGLTTLAQLSNRLTGARWCSGANVRIRGLTAIGLRSGTTPMHPYHGVKISEKCRPPFRLSLAPREARPYVSSYMDSRRATWACQHILMDGRIGVPTY